jgi:cysteine desulfuration protein SufE
MSETFQKKSEEVKNFFASCSSPEARYDALIAMGRKLPLFHPALKTPENLVVGCQSNLYLASRLIDDLLYFEAASDALISAGLAALLIAVYSGETPETILKQPPLFLADLGIHASLSPNRSNGLAHIHLRMKQEALKLLISSIHS